jgi:tRNA-2-methylthio-N6-dimethylallyladenosine synthase
MNKAESGEIDERLAQFGYSSTSRLAEADLVVLNTCVVRQAAEDKVLGMLGYLKGIKTANCDLRILVTGCFVNSNIGTLEARFPHIDLFFAPGNYSELSKWLQKQPGHGKLVAELSVHKVKPTAFVPIIQGCNKFCSYCIVPYRRGREKSRPMEDITCEVKRLVERGVREVTILGQNVNSYGHDLPARTTLSNLLAALNNVDGLARIRFLTNHPKDMSQDLVGAIASLDKVCEHITLPFQSGDDDILRAMHRDYTAEQYRNLVRTIRQRIPGLALSTDVIIGFPTETEEQFGRTLDLLEDIRFDVVHVATYSPRVDTIAARKHADDVTAEIKKERFSRLEAANERIAGEINAGFLGKTVEVLAEGMKGGKCYGRTRGDKLVFFESSEDCAGKLLNIEITKASPWALQGFRRHI